jgi:AcrR family transcriptional regulator
MRRAGRRLAIHYVVINSDCIGLNALYAGVVPKLWTETMAAHRAAVQDAVMETTVALAAEHGPASVTMSQVAQRAGITRATLYKYYPDVDSILVAWHQRQIACHLAQLAETADQAGTPGQRLHAALEAFAARIASRPAHTAELAALLHSGEHMAAAQQQLRQFLAGLLADAAKAGDVRDDIAPGELAGYCLHALTAASTLPSADAVHRLVTLTLAGLRPPA